MSAVPWVQFDTTEDFKRCLKVALRRFERCLHGCPYRDVNGFNRQFCERKFKDSNSSCVKLYGEITAGDDA